MIKQEGPSDPKKKNKPVEFSSKFSYTRGTELQVESPLTLCYCWHDHRRCGRYHSCYCNCIRNRWWGRTAAATAATTDQRGLWSTYNHRWLLGCGSNYWCWYKLSDCCIVMGFGENVGYEGWTWWCGHYNNLRKEKEVIFIYLVDNYCYLDSQFYIIQK